MNMLESTIFPGSSTVKEYSFRFRDKSGLTNHPSLPRLMYFLELETFRAKTNKVLDN